MIEGGPEGRRTQTHYEERYQDFHLILRLVRLDQRPRIVMTLKVQAWLAGVDFLVGELGAQYTVRHPLQLENRIDVEPIFSISLLPSVTAESLQKHCAGDPNHI